jgi:hypothetical protein
VGLPFGWKSFTCICLLAGAFLRFTWIGDVEYKNDEDEMFRYSQAVGKTHLWPILGQTHACPPREGTSEGREIRHPVLGVWSFAILAQVFHVTTPLGLTRAVQGLSFAALAMLFWFAWRVVPLEQREMWLWTAALASVNLLAVVYARKIWIPDLLPIYCVALLIAWSYRHTRGGAFLWGIGGALIGQVHMSGFFYSAAVLMSTALFARTTVRWRAWLAGSAWGAIPILPWLYYMWVTGYAQQGCAPTSLRTLLNLDFFRMAFEVSLSQTAEANLGKNFQEYLGYPVLFGVSTQGAGVARTLLHVIGAVVLVGAAAATLKRLGGSRAAWRLSDTDLCLLNGVLLGALLSLADVPIYPHYHLILFPLEFLWIPAVVLAYFPKPRLWLASIWLGGAVCTLAFLQFVHHHCGAPSGDYGLSYRCKKDEIAAAWAVRPPDMEPLIRPGQEEVIARMLGRGELLPGSCKLADGQITGIISATYSCANGRPRLQLVHPSRARDDALRTREFAIVLLEGSPPPGLLDAVAGHVRGNEREFEWQLEAPRETSPAELPPYGHSVPVLTSRQVLLRLVGGAVVLLLLFPWWGAGVAEARRAPTP